jgi:hypothetical protein
MDWLVMHTFEHNPEIGKTPANWLSGNTETSFQFCYMEVSVHPQSVLYQHMFGT